MDLSQVSRTAILLLICRAVESGRDQTAFDDTLAVFCLDRLIIIDHAMGWRQFGANTSTC